MQHSACQVANVDKTEGIYFWLLRIQRQSEAFGAFLISIYISKIWFS